METEKELQERLEKLHEKLHGFYEAPWTLYHEPFHVAGPIYFVGNTYVSTYLIDTDQGLILVDPGFKETQYLVFDSIRALGFDPHDIRHIFLSHGHVDHVGGTRYLQEYTKANVWLGKDDLFFFTERPDLIIDEDHVPRFRIDCSYDYQQEFISQNIKIQFIHTPGHTPGVTTFLFQFYANGHQMTAAMHGGLGLNGLTRLELEKNRLPFTLQKAYIQGLQVLMKIKVDIVLPSHNHNYDILARYQAGHGTMEDFIDPTGWKNMLQDMLDKAKDVIPEAFDKL